MEAPGLSEENKAVIKKNKKNKKKGKRKGGKDCLGKRQACVYFWGVKSQEFVAFRKIKIISG